jgi:hypothetical protein
MPEQTGAELLFEIFSQRHDRGSTIVTSNLPFEEWTTIYSALTPDHITAAGLRELQLAFGHFRAQVDGAAQGRKSMLISQFGHDLLRR